MSAQIDQERKTTEGADRLSTVPATPLRDIVDARGNCIDLRPLQTLLVRIEKTFSPEQIWLFGSRARGDAKLGSDWDLVVVVPDETKESDLDPTVSWQLQKGSGVRADVFVFRASEFREDYGAVNTLLYYVQREGVLVYER